MKCKIVGCNLEIPNTESFCTVHSTELVSLNSFDVAIGMPTPSQKEQMKTAMSSKYPKYYKDVSQLTEVDVYAIHKLFNIQDPSGAIQHASKKLLLAGHRTGGKSAYDDVREARDTLSRYLELNKPE